MLATATKTQYRKHLSRLAATAIIFCGLGANTHINATNTSRAALAALSHDHARTSVGQDIPHNVQVLSPKEADLYRAIFTAQAEGDWNTADRIITALDDQRLMGHVLADRYLRRNATLPEMQKWLAAYPGLPEASDIYDQARSLPGAKAFKLKHPVSADSWTGGGYGSSLGFQTGTRGSGLSRTMWGAGLQAWKKGDAARAGEIFAKLATENGLSSWDKAAAEFWTYRALKRSGNVPEAYYWLRLAADQPRSFYGLLANDLLGRDAGWSWEMPELNSSRASVLASHAAGWRALALVQSGRPDLAEAELNHLNPQGHKDLQEAMLALAEVAHMPSLALRLGGMAVNDAGKPYDAALYPVPPWQPAKGFQVDRALMYALMRHESQFDPVAVSGAGACGLMQLMPATARLISNDRGKGRDCSDRLLDPTTNMSFGQTYVKRLADQPMIGDNLLLMLAAYNSGPNRVSHWMSDSTRKDPLLFIESLPVRETRDYLQQVVIHYAMYRARLGEPVTVFAQLGRGEWPRYSLRNEAAELPAYKNVGIRVASNDNAR